MHQRLVYRHGSRNNTQMILTILKDPHRLYIFHCFQYVCVGVSSCYVGLDLSPANPGQQAEKPCVVASLSVVTAWKLRVRTFFCVKEWIPISTSSQWCTCVFQVHQITLKSPRTYSRMKERQSCAVAVSNVVSHCGGKQRNWRVPFERWRTLNGCGLLFKGDHPPKMTESNCRSLWHD